LVFPWQLSLKLAKNILSHKIRGEERFPWVLMLEPLFQCNLSCSGCGRIKEYKDFIDRVLTVEECLKAVDESQAPIVCLTGGEPLLHPDIDKIVAGIVSKRVFLFLSTNGLLVEKSLSKFKPSPYLSFVIHLDGLASTHDKIVEREGVFATAIEAIKAAKRAGFKVHTNTTAYKGINPQEIKALFSLTTSLGIDGIMISPAFSYSTVESDVFLSRSEINDFFQVLLEGLTEVKFYNTPLYLEFLQGKRELQCIPWANPTRNPLGWRSPCYLIKDQHYETFAQLMEKTPWQRYGVGNDPRCNNCMMHSGFEASAILGAIKSLSDLWRLVKWNLKG